MALAVEEGMIRNIANRVTSDGTGAFDVELGDFHAVGQMKISLEQSVTVPPLASMAPDGYTRGTRTPHQSQAPHHRRPRGAILPVGSHVCASALLFIFSQVKL